MIRSDQLLTRRLLICFWFPILFYSVSEGRRYDKCTTGDGREGVCVVKRYCREGSQHELLPCERDEEHHCCPIPTTQRSAATLPQRPREENQPPLGRLEPEVKRNHNTDVSRVSERDEHLNKAPSEEERRSPVNNDQPKKPPTDNNQAGDYVYDSENRRSNNYPENPGFNIERPSHNPQRRPVANPNEYDRRDHIIRQPERDSPVRQPSRGHAARQPERYNPPRQPERQPPARLPERQPPARQPTTDHAVRQPERQSPVQPNTDRAVRPPERDRIYPAKEVFMSSQVTPLPRWKIYEKTPERKNRTTDDTSKFPITFPEPYEFSVPRPKVPACGVKPYDLFIAGGQESAEHEWPWMTAIFRRYPDSRPKTFLCGGSLINTKYVLTAAHCFVNNYVILPASSFVVRLGSHYLESGEEYTVANLVIHHNHSGSDFFNDIALVRLASEVYITDKIAPICLPSPDMIHQSLVGRLATVAGWGDTAFRTSGTRILQHVTVPIVSGEECFAAYSRVRGAAFLARGSDHVVCAGLREGGKDACLGDSGGPLMIRMPDDRWIIVGIVSLGYKCAEPGYPGVYTRVTHYMSWIHTNMKRY